MELKLNYRLPQTADRKAAFQRGVESELRRRLQLASSYGIVSSDGKDVDNEGAACAVIQNGIDQNAIDVLAGTVIFQNGEYADVIPDSITSVAIDASITESQVIRLEYGEIESGDIEANPYYNFAARPTFRKKTPREMLVIETMSSFNSQPASVILSSVMLGTVTIVNGILTVDNGRDTYTFSRPWASAVDIQHRSFLGSGVATPTNPHGTTANDLSVGSFSMWQAMAGPPSCVLARPVSVGRIAGTLCTETIPAAAFSTDSTGRVTGTAGTFYAPLGFWPERLTSAVLSATPTTEVAAWIPRGRNVVAVFDPANFATAKQLQISYTKVEAGALPSPLIGRTSFDVGQPNTNELLIAGGSVLTELSDPNVNFGDVGFVPMAFDIMVGNDGKVYKRPDCLYCNTKLDSIGGSPVSFSIQPKYPSRLRLAVSDYVTGTTEIRFQITGLNELGANVSEQVSFTGLPPIGSSFSEATGQRRFTTNTYSQVNQFQVIVRNGDGPNTTVSVFADYVPDSPASADDLLLATVHWNGADVSATYSNGANVVLDRRVISRGGNNRGLSPAGTFFYPGSLSSGVFVNGQNAAYATLIEDFADPQWFLHPKTPSSTAAPIGLPSNSLGARFLYESRVMPFCRKVSTPSSALFHLIPRSIHDFPNSAQDLLFFVVLSATDGTTLTLQTSVNPTDNINSPYPPYQLRLTPAGSMTKVYYAAKVYVQANTGGLPVNETFQGFALQLLD
jgi:hypothetical protein